MTETEMLFDGYAEIANDGRVSIGYYLGAPYKCHIFREQKELIPCRDSWFYCGLILHEGQWVEKGEIV